MEFRRQLELLLLTVGLSSPMSASLWVPLGNTWRATGDTFKAIHCFRMALNARTNDPGRLTQGHSGGLANGRALLDGAAGTMGLGVQRAVGLWGFGANAEGPLAIGLWGHGTMG